MIGGRFRRPASVLDGLGVERDVSMGGDAARGARVDVFTPVDLASGPPPGSAVIVLHGAAGRREDLTQFAVALARRGHLVVNASWRLPPDPARLATGIERLRQAVAATRRRVDEPATVVAWSDAAMVAVPAVQGHQCESADIARLIVLGGYFGWRDDVPATLPATVPATLRTTAVQFFGDDDPTRWRSPFADLQRKPSAAIDVVVGEHDVNRSHGAAFADAAREAGWPLTFHVIDRCDHYELVTPRLDGGARALRTVSELARHGAAGTPHGNARSAGHRR